MLKYYWWFRYQNSYSILLKNYLIIKIIPLLGINNLSISLLPFNRCIKQYILYQFQCFFFNAIVKFKPYFFCNYSGLIIQVLNIFWQYHLIFGYSKCFLNNQIFLKIFLKIDNQGFNTINYIKVYKKYIYLTWFFLKTLIFKDINLIYLISTTIGIINGKLALKLGLGGILILKIFC